MPDNTVFDVTKPPVTKATTVKIVSQIPCTNPMSHLGLLRDMTL